MTTEPTDAQPLVLLDRITIRVRDRHLLAGTSWAIYPGQHWAVIGPNGAGKSTLVRALAGTAPVVKGRIRRTEALADPAAVGLVSFEQHRRTLARDEDRDESRSFSRHPEGLTTVSQLLETGPEDAGIDAGYRALLDLLAIPPLFDRPIRALSTGEMRKVLIARSLRNDPRLLILDEPFDGLDAGSRRQMMAWIDRLGSERRQIVMATHRWQDLPRCITHVLELEEGRVVRQGPRQDSLLEAAMTPDPAAAPAPPPGIAALRSANHAGPPLVVMTDVRVAYGRQVVFDRLTWTFQRGENWAVVGPNGAGKSSLVHLITADHLQAYANDIRLFGVQRGSGESVWDIKRRLGVVSAAVQLGHRVDISARQVVMSGFFDSVGLFRRCTADQRRTADQWIGHLGIGHLADRPFAQLSHGEQRMTLIARAMVKSPLLLVLDEPCQGLDPANRMMVLDLMERIGNRTGTHLLYVTHYPEEMLPCITHILEFVPAENGRHIARVIPR